MKTRIARMICTFLALALLSACGQSEPAESSDNVSTGQPSAYQKITAEEGKTLLESGASLTLVDVRRGDEYETAHIPSAVNIPNESIGDTHPDALPDLDGTVVVYCRTGVRSKQAANKLVELGYTDVRDMGGITDWPYLTVTGAEPGIYAAQESGAETSATGGSDETTPAETQDPGKKTAASDGIMGNFSAMDLEENTIDQGIFSDYDLTMVNVWTTYCRFCLAEMPDLGELSEEYAEKGVRIVGLVTDVLNSDGTVSGSQMDTAREIVAATGAGYLHIIPSEDLYGLLSQITTVPATFFVDSTGTQVGNVYFGKKSKAKWETIIVQTLEEVS